MLAGAYGGQFVSIWANTGPSEAPEQDIEAILGWISSLFSDKDIEAILGMILSTSSAKNDLNDP